MRFIGGFRIVEDASLTVPSLPFAVRRTWGERLFSRPWQPWVSIKKVTTPVPSKDVIRIGTDTLVMHPDIARQLRIEIEKRNSIAVSTEKTDYFPN